MIMLNIITAMKMIQILVVVIFSLFNDYFFKTRSESSAKSKPLKFCHVFHDISIIWS